MVMWRAFWQGTHVSGHPPPHPLNGLHQNRLVAGRALNVIAMVHKGTETGMGGICAASSYFVKGAACVHSIFKSDRTGAWHVESPRRFLPICP
jgi:hypothetical protein